MRQLKKPRSSNFTKAKLKERNPEIVLDPMCGSGTFIIEALMILTDRAPGLVRRFGFNGWHGHDRELWLSLKAEAAERHEKHLNNRYLSFMHTMLTGKL